MGIARKFTSVGEAINCSCVALSSISGVMGSMGGKMRLWMISFLPGSSRPQSCIIISPLTASFIIRGAQSKCNLSDGKVYDAFVAVEGDVMEGNVCRYVWHLRDKDAPRLKNKLAKLYGKAPAVVELCVQAGADIPARYKPRMRLDVIIPDEDELEMVA